MNSQESGGALSRREMLQALGVAALAGAGLTAGCAAQGAVANPAQTPIDEAAEKTLDAAPQTVAEPFALGDVRLLPSAFLDARQRDGDYLLSLEPDRMLHNFRVNAGLPPKAPVYGGWESVAMWADIRAQGHTAGHYLSACAMMYAGTGDERFKQRCDYIVSELAACQKAVGTGLVCAFPDKDAQFLNMRDGRRVIGVPWYTTHKVMAGLRDAHLYAGNADALAVLVGLADYAATLTKNMSEEQFQKMLNIEHGGMNEVLADLYLLTKDPAHLALAQRFCHKAVLDPAAAGKDNLDRLHSNTQIPKFIGFARLAQITGGDNYRAAAAFFWKTVVNNRSFITGGNGDQEHFFPPADFVKHLGSAKTMETCCSYNMLKLTRLLFTQQPAPELADYYERTLLNSILASQDPQSGMMTYFQPTRPGYLKLFCTPIDSFWCCTGTGMENHSKYNDSIYFRAADTLYVNLFIPSTVAWRDKNISVEQTTAFPDEPRTRLKITSTPGAMVTLAIRHPGWCPAARVMLNGKPVKAPLTDGYLTIRRAWRAGDVLDVDLPMSLDTIPLPHADDYVALLYGPVVLAGQLGTAGITPGADIIVNERTYGDVLNTPIAVPPLKVRDPGKVAARIHPVPGKPLTFTTGDLTPRPITLSPYFRTAHQRYTLYWKMVPA
ncbi:MAG TPA: beta-L-arabinofuranosidase domain-containing protein [Phycisphaerae bacterium]|nr:beta-L-arabinofuranosidase domain-containing protein [Phycisphaerae bacterium]